MARKVSRSDVLSLRLNEARLATLERYQDALSRQLKRQVSLAEAAVLVLEDRIERLDQVIDYGELASTPTAALARIRSRWAGEHDLSAAEWRFLAEYVHVGAEETRQAQLRQRPAVPSRETYLALLDAFEAVYRERSEPESRHAWAYFDNLGGHHSGLTLSPKDAEQRHKAVLELIAMRRSQLADPQTPVEHVGYVGRCFVLAVRDEGVSGHMLNRILAPYWSTLWGLAARGHWFRHDRRPVRVTGAPEGDLRRGLPMPPKQTEGDLSLSFVSMAGLEIAARIEIAAGARRSACYVRTYPALMECRAMLDGVIDGAWHGQTIATDIADRATGARWLWIGDTSELVLSPEDWTSLRELFRRAWDTPEMQWWLRVLREEYGEHG